MSLKYDMGEYLAERDLINVDHEERVGSLKRVSKQCGCWGWYRAQLRKLRQRRRDLRWFAKAYLSACEPERTIIHRSEGDNGSATA